MTQRQCWSRYAAHLTMRLQPALAKNISPLPGDAHTLHSNHQTLVLLPPGAKSGITSAVDLTQTCRQLHKMFRNLNIDCTQGDTMQQAYVVTGTLTDARTVMLDEALPLTPTKVRLVVEPLPLVSQRPYQEVLATIRARQRARGHTPLTKAEIDSYLQAERESWET